MKSTLTVKIDNHELSLSNLGKVLWPESEYTKGDLIRYYCQVTPYMLDYLHDRPLVFTRYPDGIRGKSFYQKNAPEYLPNWMPTYLWHSSDHSVNNLILAEEPAALVWLANQAVVEIHPWLSRKESILSPDFVVFDLDPYSGCPWQVMVDIALQIKRILDSWHLKAYLKTSGAEGLHIFVPVVNKYDYATLRNWAGQVAAAVCSAMPSVATIARSIKDRGARVYIDYLQNVVGKTLCAPYSVRPRPGAPVSTPLEWDELPSFRPSQFTIKSIIFRLQKKGDLFAPVLNDKQDLDGALNSESQTLKNR